MRDTNQPHPRSRIFYWKCDRPAPFHGTEERSRDQTGIEGELARALAETFPGKQIAVRPAATQGNHLTFIARLDDEEHFVRVEDGPEHDDYLEVESYVLERVRGLGVAAPHVQAVDASRRRVPFAWQIMDLVDAVDLNQLFKQGKLDTAAVGPQIGRAIAAWQAIEPAGFGPFDPGRLRDAGELRGFHPTYADYFHLHLRRHLDFLTERQFLTADEAVAMHGEIEAHQKLLDLPQGCLVHKDLALWNLLGTTDSISAVIDWDDCISGDPLDDFSLLGCFHDGPLLAGVIAGYVETRVLPSDFSRRFWLHLLRNLIMKSVIRVGAGYFDRSDGFFLIGVGSGGGGLREFTRRRLATALEGLRRDWPLDRLES